jgi:glycerophosphoryl diester phosphodiesterase
MKTHIFAHRGFSGMFPENSIQAFREAVIVGADGIELDVQRTADGELVVIHDERLDYSTTMTGWVRDTRWKELRTARLRPRGEQTVHDQTIPHLNDVLEFLADEGMLVNIELKNGLVRYPGIEEEVIAALDRYNLRDATIVSSFNHDSVLHVKGIDASIRTGIIFAGRLHELWNYARSLKADALHPDRGFVDAEFVHAAHQEGFLVNTYTVNDELEMQRLRDARVDGIITNFPDRLLTLMER